ncbi:MAG: TlpA family protein disulfide reductase [Bacteroidetes bacterium]|nr:TlpA family protein disulfide reductase [Bacteroidota bacterium]MBP6401924.1 TlpA family protein disulfide reductase [Bacteroidia bacterium]MBK6837012.1 TlpA family protein disulfide reductase [Bacteroidota bacterium]MBK9523586.1 TlpA family protein disulfide reductase [Bacteroidota bacterium]MBK9541334.1 TlpA family protein disulfide reductase [Bacteroidota bacterium]
MKIAVSTLLLLGFIGITTSLQAQESKGRTLPVVTVKTITGENFSTEKFSNDGKPMIIDFWATWCKPCIEELNAINEEYSTWQKETGVKLIAISVDDARTMNRVAPFVNGKGWPYENYVDPNGDFKRAMNVNMPPHTFVLNGKGEIVWQHVGFTEGNQDELYEVVKKVLEGKPIGDSK